jgi:hypothetical protein
MQARVTLAGGSAGTLSDEHARSSHGIPVFIPSEGFGDQNGQPFGPEAVFPTDDGPLRLGAFRIVPGVPEVLYPAGPPASPLDLLEAETAPNPEYAEALDLIRRFQEAK